MNHNMSKSAQQVAKVKSTMSGRGAERKDGCQLAACPGRQQVPSSPSADNQNRLEGLLEKKLMRRSQNKFCRACLSEDCRMEHERVGDNSRNNPGRARGDDEDITSLQLQSIKKKRIAVEQFLEDQAKIITTRQLNHLKKPYLPSQQHLPPWLLGVIEQELSLPLVPMFPTSEEELAKLMAEMDKGEFDEVLRKDYLAAGAHVRRVRVGVSYQSCPTEKNPGLSLTSLPQLYVYEEIADHFSDDMNDSKVNNMYFQNNDINLENGAQCLDGDRIIDQEMASTSQSNPEFSSSQNNEYDINNARCEFGQNCIPLQQMEKHLDWRIFSRCTNAKIQESRDERMMVTGLLRTRDVDFLPFRLLFFPGERTGIAAMRISGSFIRKAENSRFNLRWKYDVDIPALAIKE